MSKLTQLALSAITVAVLIGSWLTLDYGFPLYTYRPSELTILQTSINSYDAITSAVSQFLWGFRSMDLIFQSFVILAAVICCVAMLKTERRNN
jgi:multisubunit Na+/H+ antiporter MnhB subunit